LPILKSRKVSEIMDTNIVIDPNTAVLPSVDINATALNALQTLGDGADIVLVKEGSDVVGYVTVESFRKIIN